jgi:hypothetical protein
LFAVEALIFVFTLILRVRLLLLSSLAPCEDQPAHCGGEDQVFGLLVPPLLSSLAPVGDELARHGGCAQVLTSVMEGLRLFLVPRVDGRVVLVFDLVDVAEAVTQFEQSLDTSQWVTAHLVQLMVYGEVLFDRFLCWLVLCFFAILV